MKFVDQVSLSVEGGHGGSGASSFRREKYVPHGGPDGGDGGNGGDVVVVASRTVQTLMDISLKRHYKGQAGLPGKGKNQFGQQGKDCEIIVPCGTVVSDADTHEVIADLVHDTDRCIVAKGGRGGKGNARFSTSVNRAPRYAQPGEPGTQRHITLELKLLAQVGLVGKPNAGKSTLLKTLTRANAKIGAYPFTTLYPNLGVLRVHDKEVVLADIPGLIEGASQGQGLGTDFLRHVDRTQLIIHLVEAQNHPENCWDDYQIIRNELAASRLCLSTKAEFDYHQDVDQQDLSEFSDGTELVSPPFSSSPKKEIVAISKIDLVSPEELQSIQEYFVEQGVPVIAFSSATHAGLDGLIQLILKDVQ